MTMPLYTYSVTAKARATTTEQWTVRSNRPLTREEVEDALSASDTADIQVEFDSEEVDDEEDRTIVEVIDDATGQPLVDPEDFEPPTVGPEVV